MSVLQDLKKEATVGVEDLVMLPTLNDKAIVENTKLRFSKDLIYTNIGSVLISVNPFKRIPMYGPEQINFYRTQGKSTTQPHIFGLAEDTYRTMILEEENQCVIISGESGAGKTEASKQIMQYIAAVSGNSDKMQRVKEIMLESNPLLEAFGNAKTVRNDNSSRFGKFFEIYFDRVGGPLGGKMSNFLLEKSRVVKQQRGERNFHIFYQMCRGADAAMRERLHIRQPEEFVFLNMGQAMERAGVDDAKEWQETIDAMKHIGWKPEDQEAVFSLLAAILHLGEIKFQKRSGGQEDEHEIANKDASALAAKLLCVEQAALERALTWKKLEMSNETLNVSLDGQQCNAARDAIAKAIYDKIFDFVVRSVNLAFGQCKYDLMLGVLDIYGFEIFEKNGFEQFCINYVNEKLQQIFIELTLKVEQEEYVREKIAWEEIKFFNNKVVCDLIESNQPPNVGLFTLCDEACATMAKEKESVADIKMLDKFMLHSNHAHFTRKERGFIIRHYAGDVTYDAAGFIARNKDLLSKDVMVMMQSTTHKFLATLLQDVNVEIGGKKSTTAGCKIRQQAADLVRTLMNCTPHYVRTVKSNDEKRANFIDDARVTHQCKYLGLLENIRVRRAGFAYRQYFEKFIKRFKYCSPETFPRAFKGTDKNACLAIMKACQHVVPEGSWQLGETKVFIRQPQHLFALEAQRQKTFDRLVLGIQRAYLKFKNRKEYIILKKNMDKIYNKGRKERRADSVFRPYQGTYIDYRKDLPQPVHDLVDYDCVAEAWKEHFHETGKRYYVNGLTQETTWNKPPEMEQQRMIYTDKVDRIVNCQKAELKKDEYFLLSDRAIYFIELQTITITPPAVKKTKQNPNPHQPPPYTTQQWILNKRLDIRLLSGVSVSATADPYALIHFYQAPVPYRPVYNVPTKGTPNCMGCGVKFKAADKRANCPGCGALLCLKTCLTQGPRAFPTLGHPKPVKCCANCVTGEPHEPVEDVIICSPQKSEIVAMIRKVYRQVMGNKIPINVNNNIAFQLFGESFQRQMAFQVSAELKKGDSNIFPSDKQLVVHCAQGIQQSKIDEIERNRAERAKIQQERFRKELAASEKREQEKEKEREEAHRKMVAERKAAKAAQLEKDEEDKVRAEQEAQERRLNAQRRVAEGQQKR